MPISNEDLKIIIDNLYKSNFYEAINKLKKLEKEFEQVEEINILYYFTYDFMEWLTKHENNKSVEKIANNKNIYFNKINEDKSNAYLKLYIFLEKNFNTFERFTWFGKQNKSINLLNNALKENPNNLEAKFYLLFENEKINDCFKFLNDNTLNTDIIKSFIDSITITFTSKYQSKILKLRKKYNLLNDEKNNYNMYSYSKNYKLLYEYFNNNEIEKYKKTFITFGEVCFKLKKYDEAIKFYKLKKNKNGGDYFLLGKCYEIKKNRKKAIEAYKNYFINFDSGQWISGIERLIHLKEYDEAEKFLKDSSHSLKEYNLFYEAKILNIKKLYKNSTNLLDNIFNSNIDISNEKIKKNIYLLYISNYFYETIKYLEELYNNILKNNDFELKGNFFTLNYTYFSTFKNLEKYAAKLNIEFKEKYSKKIELYKKNIHNKYINIHKKLYIKVQKINFILSEEKELYYLSFFDDINSINKEISICRNRLKDEPNNPYYNLSLGNKYYKNKNFEKAKQYYEKSIELSRKYFLNLNGQPELNLIKMNINSEYKKQLFDDSMKNFISFNSYQRDTILMFFEQILYKYQSFSLNSLSSLSNNYLYFANPNKLNDPFDVASISLEKQFENLKIDKKYFKTCSLSKINDNKLMWSHYGNEHTGICIGYKFLYLPNYVGKEKVTYKNTNLPEKDIFKTIMDYWIIKSEDWEYEQEIRLLHYGEKEKINYTFDKNQAFDKNIIGLKIVSITLGLNFKEDNFNIIKQVINEIENKQELKIKIFKAKILEQKLILEKIDLK
ncbi:DUF2971 domain-containing protein [Aliarcobacter butzleri]|uniref:DUF2971 domain-containing protein n=1 Tax=Aliarcobacter butzleri TaxID=28197 RepID=UPI003AFA9751